MDESLILSVRNLRKRFPILGKGIFRREISTIQACDDVSFDVRRGETLAVVGGSGSGKTTLGRLILRALAPDSGQIFFRSRERPDPVDLAVASARELKPLRRELQMIFQDPYGSLNPHMTVAQIVEEPLYINKLASGTAREMLAREMLAKVGLPADCMVRYPNAFSGGQRQRIAIARALVVRPSLVVCDEPVSALDVSVQAQIINLLADMQEEFGLTYLFVAHDWRVVRHLAHRVAELAGGKLTEPVPTESFFSSGQNRGVRSTDGLASRFDESA